MNPVTVNVSLAGQRGYPVQIGPGLLGELGGFVAGLGSVSRAAVISDSTVAELYGAAAVESLRSAGLAADLLAFPAGEANKTLARFAGLFDGLFALDPAVDRSSVIVALGGGVAGDMAGFVAATALRGLRWVQAPTTVLADVDASVGGKTAVDHPAGKNLVGAFHQPRGVLIDTETLRSLPPRQVRNGLAECVKHAVIRDAELLDWLKRFAAPLAQTPHAPQMTELLARNVAIKAAVVESDERESGVRQHLNFGHTIGHAIEAAAGYDQLLHGEAVSLGMVAAMHLAAGRGLIGSEDLRRVERLLSGLDLPVRRAGLDFDALWRIMLHDKKNRAGRVRMVLPVRLGAVEVFDDATRGELAAAVSRLAGERSDTDPDA
jgi:3-dehydroquinate synthase